MCSVLTWNRVTMRSGCRTSEVPLYRDLENHVMHLMQGMHSWTDTVGSGQVNHVQCTYLEQWAADAVPQICPFVGIWNTM